ncbi:hypothetical protein TUZN_1505 [Thermoproteus uzoniensis 768-20]|uniref:Uncharacterized protein n=1 Tax=Thermoproteus uzoniensis (strain 768-20) TaxID=999630 RepID=F2L249_THEU7|nr:hypothetical protein [Thermoproteus uzoniensis]AEA12976.1 hypothetical protein TUZN_1505 [Thermoproteus uzoniensis 768-20]
MLSDFLNASYADLVKKYGAVKKDDVYEVPLQNAPWTFSRPLSAFLSAGSTYIVEGVDVSWEGPGEVYVVLTNWEVGFGLVLARRRRLFRCIRRQYAAPYGVRLPQHIRVRPVELVLSDSDAVECVDRPLEAKAIAVLPSTVYVLNSLRVDLSNARLRESRRNV